MIFIAANIKLCFIIIKTCFPAISFSLLLLHFNFPSFRKSIEYRFIFNYFINLTFFILSLRSISYCRFKYIRVYIFQRFKLNAVSAHTRLANFFSIGLG